VERGEDGHWVGTLRGSTNVRTRARTLESLHERIPSAIATAGEPKGEVRYQYPREYWRHFIAANSAKRKLSEARHSQDEALAVIADAARELKNLGLSVRDVAELIGFSHQRVQQLVGD
jgi:hypothetical protein